MISGKGITEDADRSRTGEPKNGHEDKHTENRMPIFGRGKQEIFAWRWKDRNWSKRRTLCIWEGRSAHKRGLIRMWNGELVWRGDLAGAGEYVELQGTEQGHKNTHVYEVLMLSNLYCIMRRRGH